MNALRDEPGHHHPPKEPSPHVTSKPALSLSLLAITSTAIANVAVAQAPYPNPTYTAGGKTNLVTSHSPAVTQFGNAVWLVYSNSNDAGFLYASPNTQGGLSFPSPGTRIGTNAITSGVSAVAFNGTLYAVAATYTAINLYRSTDGVNWRTTLAIGAPYNPSQTARPGLGIYNNQLILSFLSGNQIRTAVYAPGTSNQDFSVDANSPGPAGGSGASLWQANGALYMAYTSGDGSGFPVVCYTNDRNGNFTAGNPCNTFQGIRLGGDPSLAYQPSNGTFALQGRSYYSDNNLWGTTVGLGLNFTPQYKYGQVLTESPYLDYFNGHLYQCGKSGYGNNTWCYYN